VIPHVMAALFILVVVVDVVVTIGTCRLWLHRFSRWAEYTNTIETKHYDKGAFLDTATRTEHWLYRECSSCGVTERRRVD
jgi:hypothetical protein